MAPVLDNPNEPVSDLSYFDCLDVVIEKSKVRLKLKHNVCSTCTCLSAHHPLQVLGEAGASITTHAKKGAYDEFSGAVENTSHAVCQLAEAASQAAYLVGIADPSSTAATPGLVDQAQFARANQAISTACQNLLNPASNQQQVRLRVCVRGCGH